MANAKKMLVVLLVIVGLVSVAGASALDQYSSGTIPTTRAFNHSPAIWGQSFTPTLDTLDAVMIKADGPGLLMEVEVWACDPNAASNADPRTGDLLGSQTIWSVGSAQSPQVFTLDTPIDVSAYKGTPGSIMFTVESVTPYWGLIGTWQDDDGSAYAGGVAYSIAGGVWEKSPPVARDLWFQTYGTGGGPTFLLGDANGDGVVSAGDYAAVQANFGNTLPTQGAATPEPATMCLLGIGGLLTVIKRRRK